jgi:3-hydroxy-3-methylglutaryl CoA synthase
MSKIYIKKYVDYELEYAQYVKDVDKNYNRYLGRLSLKYEKYRMIFFDQNFGSDSSNPK